MLLPIQMKTSMFQACPSLKTNNAEETRKMWRLDKGLVKGRVWDLKLRENWGKLRETEGKLKENWGKLRENWGKPLDILLVVHELRLCFTDGHLWPHLAVINNPFAAAASLNMSSSKQMDSNERLITLHLVLHTSCWCGRRQKHQIYIRWRILSGQSISPPAAPRLRYVIALMNKPQQKITGQRWYLYMFIIVLSCS